MDISTINAPHYLFNKGELREYLDAQLRELAKEIDNLAPNAIINTDVEEFVTYATHQYQLTTPTLREADITVDQHETKVDVSGDMRYFASVLNPGKPHHITGAQVNY